MDMHTICTCLVLLLLAIERCHAKKFTRCELDGLLRENGFFPTDISNWVCLIEAETDNLRDSSLKKRKGGEIYGWGLFQLSNPTVCTPGSEGGTCNIKCEDLLSDDITKAAKCASKVYKESGFSVWVSWTAQCEKKAFPKIECSRPDWTGGALGRYDAGLDALLILCAILSYFYCAHN